MLDNAYLKLTQNECRALDNVDNYLWTWSKFTTFCENGRVSVEGECLETGLFYILLNSCSIMQGHL